MIRSGIGGFSEISNAVRITMMNANVAFAVASLAIWPPGMCVLSPYAGLWRASSASAAVSQGHWRCGADRDPPQRRWILRRRGSGNLHRVIPGLSCRGTKALQRPTTSQKPFPPLDRDRDGFCDGKARGFIVIVAGSTAAGA